MSKLHHVELLDLSGKDRLNLVHYSVPHEISLTWFYKDLKYLCLEGQALKTLPQSLQLCEKLEVLDIRHNKFSELPFFLKDMPKLKHLKRNGNPLTWTNPFYELRTIKKYPEANDEAAKEKRSPTRVHTLLNIAFDFKCKQKLLSFEDIDMLNLPLVLENLFYKYNGLLWEYCYHCKKGLDKECEGTWMIHLLIFDLISEFCNRWNIFRDMLSLIHI